MTLVTTWMNFECIMLNEMNQIQRDLHLHENPRVAQFIETRAKWWLPGAGRGVGRELEFKR